MSKHFVVLDRVTYTPKMVFLGFKEITEKKGAKTNFFSQMFSTRYASIGDIRQVMEDRVKKAQDKFGFSIDPTNGKVDFEDEMKPVTIQDILPEFRNIEPAICYEYVSAQEYEGLSEVERRAYQPAVIADSTFYQTDPKTGEVVRDENGRAVVDHKGPAYFTKALGEVLFRTSAVHDASFLELEGKLVRKDFDSDVVEMLEDCPAALEAINARLQVATEQETAADELAV